MKMGSQLISNVFGEGELREDSSFFPPADIIWRFSTAWYGTVWFSMTHFRGGFHWVQYLVLFLVPPQSRF